MSRFPILASGKKGSSYDLKFTGTPARKMKFSFRGVSKQGGMIIRILYVSADSRAVLKNKEEIPYNAWDDATRAFGEVKGTKCGENRYVGVKNLLEFYITSQCEL